MKHLPSRKAIAVYGGSFDPVHLGHMAVANLVWQSLSLKELRFLPCKIAPHKDRFFSDEHHRLTMLRLALKDTPFAIDDSELQKPTTSYSVQSMSELRDWVGKEASLIFIVGTDSLVGLHTWWRWEALFEYVNLVVVGRPGVDEKLHSSVSKYVEANRCPVNDLTDDSCGKIAFLSSSKSEISSSDIRAEIAANREKELPHTLKNSLAQPVFDYIQSNKLYFYQY